ncbi:MAG: tetratricopeptide repeat protein [Candidatus Aminicenantes bacterium]|nr:tetratricopeptide repeat protein [Candidatus Aminicenantes bacterium]
MEEISELAIRIDQMITGLIKSIKKSINLQPDFDFANRLLIGCYILQENNQKAIEHSQKFLSINPNSPGVLEWAGHTALLSGNYEQAQEFYQKANLPIYLGYVYWKTGKQDEARKLFQKSLNLYKAKLDQGYEIPDVPYLIACIHTIQGDKEEAYEWLRKTIDAGWGFYRRGLIDPLLENLHQDDQFKQMMEQVKQKIDEMRKRIEENE